MGHVFVLAAALSLAAVPFAAAATVTEEAWLGRGPISGQWSDGDRGACLGVLALERGSWEVPTPTNADDRGPRWIFDLALTDLPGVASCPLHGHIPRTLDGASGDLATGISWTYEAECVTETIDIAPMDASGGSHLRYESTWRCQDEPVSLLLWGPLLLSGAGVQARS